MKILIHRLLIALSCLLATFDLIAQPLHVEWQRCYGGSRSENNEASPSATALFHTSDTGFIFISGINSGDGDISGYHDGPQGTYADGDFWVVKTSSTGDIEWQKCIGGSMTDMPLSLAPTRDGGYVITGWTGSDDGDISVPSPPTENKWDAWVVKIDSVGSKEWDSRIGGSEADRFTTITQTTDGGYIAAGSTFSRDEVWLGESWWLHQGGLAHSSHVMVVKLNPDGKVEWKKLLGGSAWESASSIVQLIDGGYIFTGYTQSPDDGHVSGIHGDTSSRYCYKDIWVVRLDAAGNILWQKCFGGTSNEEGNSIFSTSDGGFIIGGSTQSNDGDVTGFYGSNLFIPDGWVVKIDSAGALEWQKCLGGTGSDGINSVIEVADGYLFAGSTTSLDGDVSGLHRGMGADSGDVWIGKLSLTGELLWQQCLGGTKGEAGHAIIATADGGYTVYGKTFSNNGDVLGNHGGSDAWLVHLKLSTGGVEASSGSSGFAHPFPNPSSRVIHLRLYQAMAVKHIGFFNLMGIEYFPEYRIDNSILTADVHTLPKGVYMVRVTYATNPETQETRKFLISE